jgi:O-antigen ligase
MAFIISAELIALFISSDTIFIDGSINKVSVALGWGIWNLIGASAVVLIPMNFYGMAKNKCPWLYFSVATLIWLVSILSMSRNALIFGTLSYAACVLIFSFVGEKKKIFRIIVLIGIAFAGIFAIVFFDKIYSLFKDFFDRGLSDNGRFALWRSAFENFLDSPIFGKGFYGFNTPVDTFGPMPESAHNTVLQLLSAGGLVSLSAYAFYRFKTVIPFVKKPCLLKSMLGISILSLLLGSLLDNFIFDIYPTFYMNIALAICFKKFDEENEASLQKAENEDSE